MARPRKSLICLSQTPYYHCVSRCVRRAYLCGRDAISGQSYEHRRQWVESRIQLLSRVFAIDVCAYAVMSNHTHLVLHVNQHSAMVWSDEEVLRRWHRIHKGMLCTKKYLDTSQRQSLSDSELVTVKSLVKVYRNRLYDISWFMRLLNEYIARLANREDDCTGRFWEGRFKSQALEDEAALAACMSYVDLNPVRAGIASSPGDSAHTSIQRRLKYTKAKSQPRDLMPLASHTSQGQSAVLPFHLESYIGLVEETACAIFSLSVKPTISASSSIILNRIGLSPAEWHRLVTNIESRFGCSISLKVVKRRLAFA